MSVNPTHRKLVRSLIVCGVHTDVGDGWGHTDLNTRISLLSQLPSEELVELGVENTIGDDYIP